MENSGGIMPDNSELGKIEAFRVVTGRYGMTWLKEFNPTGRWMIKYGPEWEGPIMMVEHKGWLFKQWISENNIRFGHRRESMILVCGKCK
jgi:hypothetical protein